MVDEETLRGKVWKVIEAVQREKVFLHSKTLTVRAYGRERRIPLVSGLAILNAIVGNGSMLLYGGYGYGKTTFLKYLGRMMTGTPVDEIEASILRSNPQLTEEKIVARLHLGRLISEGEEVVIWRRFVRSFWKIVDEINRLSPGAQDAILSLLGEGIAKYFDAVYAVRRYVLYATLNPRDVGTFPLGMPLLDRFGIAIIVEAPTLDDAIDITELPDDKMLRRAIPAILDVRELVASWGYVETMKLSEEAKLFISTLVKELSLCDRVRKETGVFLSIGPKLCAGCQFEALGSPCRMTLTPLSIRAQRDLVRYSKALAWLLGLDEVTLDVVVAIAPYVIWHRLKYPDKYLERKHHNRFEVAREIVRIVLNNFLQRYPLIRAFENIRRGSVDPKLVEAIRRAAKGDLVIKHEILPQLDDLLDEKYLAHAKRLLSAIEERDRRALMLILEEAKKSMSPSQYNSLLRTYRRLVGEHRKRITVPFAVWSKVASRLSEIFQSAEIPTTLDPPRAVRVELETEWFEIYTISEDAPVFILIYSLWDDLERKINSILGPSDDRSEGKAH